MFAITDSGGGGAYSRDALLRGRRQPSVRRWQLLLLRAQMVQCYFFGGVASFSQNPFASRSVRPLNLKSSL